MNKILIEMKHGLGDCVCMIPAIRAIRENNPDAFIALILNGKLNEEIFRHSGINIDKIYYFSLKNRSKIYTLKTLFQLWNEHFDYGILATMTPPKKGKILFRILGIPFSHCFGEQYEGLKFLDLDNVRHFVDRNLDVAKPLIYSAIENRQPQLFVLDEKLIKVKSYIPSNRKKIAISIGRADKNYYKGNYVFTRGWDTDCMVKLVTKLSNLNYDICLLGGRLESELLSKYTSLLKKDNVINLVDKISISECMAILKECCLSIGVDTGMQHIADALGVPTLSIFGPTNPKTHGAYSKKGHFIERDELLDCQYCFDTDKYYTCSNRRCLTEIKVEDVYKRVIEILCIN